jgi:flagellin
MSLVRINQNISAMNAQRNLEINANRLGRAIERLASGLRINRGADDPAGLVISELLRVQVSGLDVAQSNAAEGVNLIKTAEGALSEVSGLLRQMRDLAVSAASDSNKNEDARAALQSQVQSALTTIDMIAGSTRYAGRSLLDGSAGTDVTIVDNTTVTTQGITSLGTQDDGYISIQVNTAAEQAVSASDTTAGVVAGNAITGTGDIVIGAGDTVELYVNGVKVQDGGGDLSIVAATTWGELMTAINTTTALDGVVTAGITGGEFQITTDDYGSAAHVTVSYEGTDVSGTLELRDLVSDTVTGINVFEADSGVDVAGDLAFGGNALTGGVGGGDDVTFAGTGLTLSHATYGSVTLEVAAATAAADYDDVMYAEDGALSFQIGYNAGDSASTSIGSMKTVDLGTSAALSTIDISTVAGAETALGIIDEAITQVSTVRGALGAFQVNELEAEARSLAVSRENLAASESQIRDTDFGREMAEFTTTQVLVQSATAFLAQANALPQAVLMLIGG